MIYYHVTKNGLYLTPDATWTDNPDDASAFDIRDEAETVATAIHGVVQRMDYTPPQTGRQWDQARSCWADEPFTDGTEWADFHAR